MSATMFIHPYVKVYICLHICWYIHASIRTFICLSVCSCLPQYVPWYVPSLHAYTSYLWQMYELARSCCYRCLNSESVRLHILSLDIYSGMPNGVCVYGTCCRPPHRPRGMNYQSFRGTIGSAIGNFHCSDCFSLYCLYYFVSSYYHCYYSTFGGCVLQCIIHHYDCHNGSHQCGPSSVRSA